MKNRYCHIVACLLLSVASAFAQQSWMGFTNHPEEQNALFDAFDCFDESNFLGAARQFRQLRFHIDSMSIQSKSGLLDYTMLLKTEGNCWYLVGNKRIIKEVLNQYDKVLEQHGQLLTSGERDSMMLDVYKLQGSWHYENADADTASFQKAADCYQRCLDYYRQHPTWSVARNDTAVLHQEFSQLYYKQQRWSAALKEIAMVVRQYRKECFEQSFREEGEYYGVLAQYAICLARTGQFKEALQKIDEAIKGLEPQQGVAYAEAMRKKAKILLLQNGQDVAQALPYYKTYFTLRKEAALQTFAEMSSDEREQFWMRLRPFISDCYQVGDADASFLYDVVLFSKGLLLQLNRRGGGVGSLTYSWQVIQQQLPVDGCAIEFIQYEKNGSQQMSAVVLHRSGQPAIVQLVSPDSVLDYKFMDLTPLRSLLAERGGSKKNLIYRDSAAFSKMIWIPALQQAVGKAHNIYFAPDGYFHQIAIEYMLPATMSACRLHRLTSTRVLMEKQLEFNADRALIVGGVDYQGDAEQSGGDNDEQAYRYISGRGIQFSNLPNSRVEVDSIYIFRSAVGDTLLVDGNATEQAFSVLCGQYPLVHLSTHGLFGAATSPTGTDVKPYLTDESLSECVLAMAGVNPCVGNDKFNPSHRDGLLSARELSDFDMSRVQLIVLAACQTGLGYLTPDGVFGLQRGLKNAGVKSMIVTLWEVDDAATNLFMLALHDKLKQGMPISEAFYTVRRAFSVPASQLPSLGFSAHVLATLQHAQEDGDENTFYNEPVYRDPFILIDSLR